MDSSDKEELEKRLSKLEEEVQNLKNNTNNTKSVNNTDHYETDTTTNLETESDDQKSFPNVISTIEENIAKVFVTIGGGLLVFATIFFIQLAISAGLIGPLGQLTIATISGFGIIGVGRYAIEKLDIYPWDRIVIGTGAVISFISIYASYGSSSYQSALGTPYYIPFILMSIFLGVLFYDSVGRFEYGLIGEYTVLFWFSGILIFEQQSDLLMGGFILLGLILIAILGSWTSWELPAILSVIPLYSYFTGSVIESGTSILVLSSLTMLLFVTLETNGLVSRSEIFKSQHSPTEFSIIRESLLPLNTLVVLISLWFILEPTQNVGQYIGISSLVLAGVSGISYWITSRKFSLDFYSTPFILYFCMGFGLTQIFDDFIRILGIGVIILFGLYLSKQKPEFANFGSASHLLSGVIFVDGLRVAYTSDTFQILSIQLDSLRASVFIALTLLYYIVFILAKRDLLTEKIYNKNPFSIGISNIYAWGGTVSLILFFEIVFTGVLLSVSWSIIGLILIFIGSQNQRVRVRTQGISLLLFTTLKVIIVDTSQLDLLPRMGSFVVLGLVLILVSYWYLKEEKDKSYIDKLT